MSPMDPIRALWSAYESRGIGASLELLDEQCEWVPSDDLDLVGKGPIRGADAMRARAAELDADGVRVEPAIHTCEELAEDVVLAGGRMRVVAPGALFDSPLFWIYRLRAGRIVRIESYASRNAALTASLTA